MYHRVRLSKQEKIDAWFSLCDFIYMLLRDSLGKKGLARRFKKIREEQIRTKYSILRGLSRVK